MVTAFMPTLGKEARSAQVSPWLPHYRLRHPSCVGGARSLHPCPTLPLDDDTSRGRTGLHSVALWVVISITLQMPWAQPRDQLLTQGRTADSLWT